MIQNSSKIVKKISFLTQQEQDIFRNHKLKLGKIIEKEFEFNLTDCYMPNLDSFFTSERFFIPELLKLKDELNTTKNLLDKIDISTWNQHAKKCNLLGSLPWEITKNMNAEMCTIAWLKMTEILFAYNLLDLKSQTYSSFHLCEAPGAFICAINHFLKTNYIPVESNLHSKYYDLNPNKKVSWTWNANSLNPYYDGNKSMIDDDRLISRTSSNWHFGADNSGNIMSSENILNISYLRDENDLVTGDGSIDCEENFNEQEYITSHLHFCELVASLSLLKIGGNLVLKKFTFFENETIGLLYLCCNLFKRVIICKPAASKSYNSETYLVGLSFLGVYEKVHQKLLSHVDEQSTSKVLFGLDSIPYSFIQQVFNCANVFSSCTSAVIRNNICLFNDTKLLKKIYKEKENTVKEWMQRFMIKKIDNEMKLVPSFKLETSRNK